MSVPSIYFNLNFKCCLRGSLLQNIQGQNDSSAISEQDNSRTVPSSMTTKVFVNWHSFVIDKGRASWSDVRCPTIDLLSTSLLKSHSPFVFPVMESILPWLGCLTIDCLTFGAVFHKWRWSGVQIRRKGTAQCFIVYCSECVMHTSAAIRVLNGVCAWPM